jgi:hypothetical protein
MATPGRDEKLLKGFVVRNGAQRRETLAARRRREARREEWTQQTKLARMLASYLDRRCTFWTSLENKPRSFVSAVHQRRRGCKSGLPDVVVVQQQPGRLLIVWVELKSARGLASGVQKQVRAELLAAGAEWWMARSANAAMMALYRSGMAFSRPWEPPQLVEWERGHFPTRTSGSARAGCGGAAPGGTAAVSGTSACSQGHATGSRTAANVPRLNGCPRRRALAAGRPTDAVGSPIRQSEIQTTGQFGSTSSLQVDDGIVGIRAPVRRLWPCVGGAEAQRAAATSAGVEAGWDGGIRRTGGRSRRCRRR